VVFVGRRVGWTGNGSPGRTWLPLRRRVVIGLGWLGREHCLGIDMAQCVQLVSGQLQIDSTPASSCTGYLLLTADEVTLLHALPPLSASDGALIGSAMLGLWALAFVFRSAVRVIYQREEE